MAPVGLYHKHRLTKIIYIYPDWSRFDHMHKFESDDLKIAQFA